MKLALVLAIAVLVSLAVSAQADSVKLRLGPQGDILGWLVVGPLPNPGGNEHESCLGFDEDYLAAYGGEKGVAPADGSLLEAGGLKLKWKLYFASEKQGLNFVAAFGSDTRAVAYAYAVVESNAERDMKLFMGSDDGVKVWLNGKMVHTKHLTRGVVRDNDKIDVSLKLGKNIFLFKVDQAFGGWALMARLVNPDGTPARDLVEDLQVSQNTQPNEQPAAAVSRHFAGKPGSLDIADLLKIGDIKSKAEPMLAHFKSEIQNSDELIKAIQSASARLGSINSLASADAASSALDDAAGSLQAVYDKARSALVSKYQDPAPLIKTDPSKEDYVSVMPGGRYFMHANGTPFTPIGYNHNPDWTTLTTANPDAPNYDPKVTEDFFVHLRESGVNLVRMMIETPASGMLENPLGTFRPEHVRWIDHIVSVARKNDIKLMITPWDTFWMVRTWEISPYNKDNGGPVVERIDFITKREVVEAQKKRLKYMIDRWGNSGTVFAWELLNEGELYWKETPQQLAAWTSEMTSFVKDYEKKKWGRNHVLASSIAWPMPEGELANVAYRQPGLDMATTHLYIGASRGPKEPIEPALDIRQGVTYALRQIKDNRPYIDGEDGPIDKWIADGKLDDAVFHNMTWAHMTSGGAGSGFRWPYRNPHHLSEGMYSILGLVRKFADSVPWTKLSGELSQKFDVQAPEDWISCHTATPRAAVVWLRAKGTNLSADISVNISWPDGPAKIRCRAYDTQTGTWFPSGTINSSSGSCTLSLSPGSGSIAVVLEAQ